MLIELSLGALALGAYWKKSRENKTLPAHVIANREAIYDTAINSLKDAGKLRELATAFRTQGMTVQADMLEKRAALAEASPEVKAQRREIFRKAMESRDRNAVMQVAKAFEDMGATGAAANLKLYASGLVDTNVEIGSES